MQLAICFLSKNKLEQKTINNTKYFPVKVKNKFLPLFIKDNLYLKEYLTIIENFNPDIIHVFGTESNFGLLNKYTSIPIVIHLQGILNPYLNAYFPPNKSIFNYIFNYSVLKSYFQMKLKTPREIKIIKNNKFFTGRTAWDYSVVKLINNKIKYFHCDEILRDKFYNSFTKLNLDNIILFSTISNPIYKGFDLIQKTCKFLNEFTNINYVWQVAGVNHKSKLPQIQTLGKLNDEILTQKLKKSSLYIHTSYIDNSPNSLCEAQILGIPVISTNVGGIDSLIENEVSGFKVPANDPYYLASLISNLINDKIKLLEISKNGHKLASKRHDVNKIVQSTIDIYKNISNDENK